MSIEEMAHRLVFEACRKYIESNCKPGEEQTFQYHRGIHSTRIVQEAARQAETLEQAEPILDIIKTNKLQEWGYTK